MKLLTKTRSLILGFIFASLLFAGSTHVSPRVDAAASNPAPEAKVSFTFDDGPRSNYSVVAPILAKYGYGGTAYITTSCVGKTTVPNNCKADTNVPYMTWAQIKALQNTYGWEIGAHSVSHPLMTEISNTKLQAEVANSKQALVNQGFNPTSFATPYGDYNQNVLAAIAKHYTNHRPFHDTGYNVWPYSNYVLKVQQVQMGVSVDTVKSYIDQAAADNTWLILVFHEVSPSPSTNPEDYQYSATDLDTIASYVKSKNIKVSNVSESLVTAPKAENLVTAPDTGANIGGGWTTDSATNVKIDTTTKGSAPEPVRAVRVTSNTAKNVHVYTPTVNVNPNSKYVIKGYVNLATLTGGEVGFYIDEYDANGNWISGQYKQTISAWYVKDLSFMYAASSPMVAKARLQIIITQASGVTVYIDNVQWFAVVTGPAPDPEPIKLNLLSNGDFENGMTGWTTDNPGLITHDTTGKGSAQSPVGSVKMVAGTSNAHLFSQPIAVTFGKTYIFSGYANIVSLTSGEVGFYIDEYDANGNWISGKYVSGIRTTGSQSFSFNYTPTSSAVVRSSWQLILGANSGISAYIDQLSIVAS